MRDRSKVKKTVPAQVPLPTSCDDFFAAVRCEEIILIQRYACRQFAISSNPHTEFALRAIWLSHNLK